MKQRLGQFGSRFVFEFFVETMHDTIVKSLRNYLASIKSEDIPEMVRESRFSPLEKIDFSVLTDNAEHIKNISAVRLMELLGEARPDLATVIQDMGMPGAEYIVKLRARLLDLVMHPENTLGQSSDYKPELEMVKATCSNCGKSWPVPKDEASSIDKCPFCRQ